MTSRVQVNNSEQCLYGCELDFVHNSPNNSDQLSLPVIYICHSGESMGGGGGGGVRGVRTPPLRFPGKISCPWKITVIC